VSHARTKTPRCVAPNGGWRRPEDLLNELAREAIDPACAEDLRLRAKRLHAVKAGAKDAFRRTFEEAYRANLYMMSRSEMWKRHVKDQQFTAEFSAAVLASEAGPCPEENPEWWPS
jgi:hypothetical protein